MATVLSSKEYYDSLPKWLMSDNGSVTLKALNIVYTPNTKPIFAALSKRSLRDPVTVIVDHWQNATLVGGMPKFLGSIRPQESGLTIQTQRATNEQFKKLTAGGARIIVTNKPENPLATFFGFLYSRNHWKFTDTGGHVLLSCANINDHEGDTHQLVLLLCNQEQDIINQLRLHAPRVNAAAPKIDTRIPCRADSSILIDAGTGKSLILDNMIREVDRAKTIVYANFPDLPHGPLGEAIQRALRRGVAVKIITTKNPHNLASLATHLSRKPNLVGAEICAPVGGATHGKLLIVDGEIAMIGSHNAHELLVKAHTSELSLITGRATIVDPLVKYFESSFFTGQQIKC